MSRDPFILAEEALEEIGEAAAKWVEWRSKQCDFPDGLSDEEVKLIEVLYTPSEAKKLLGSRLTQ